VFVCQDDANTAPGTVGNQNFKLTRLERVIDLTVGGNVSQVARFTATCSELACTFDATASTDADGEVVSYDWDFGDGTTGSGPMPAHTYAGPGTRLVTLTVRDDDAALAVTAQSVVTTGPTGGETPVRQRRQRERQSHHAFGAGSGAGPAGRRAAGVLHRLGLLRHGHRTGRVHAARGGELQRPGGAAVVEGADRAGHRGDLHGQDLGADEGGPDGHGLPRHRGGPDLGAEDGEHHRAHPDHPDGDRGRRGQRLVSYWADKSGSTIGWTTPTGQTVRTGSTGTGSGHITAVLADADDPVSPGPVGNLAATADATCFRAATFTVVLPAGTGNQPPTASFTVSCVQLECAFDGSGSADPTVRS
jgi:PKD repeat protein